MHYLGQLPDLPLPHTGGKLRTRRKPLAQIVLCQGCCCGQTVRDLPGVPLDWLKQIWKSEKLNKTIQLSVSGCLGPCDLPNVCTIVSPEEQTWYGRLSTREDYAVLVQWARRCQQAKELQPLPSELDHLRFQRWPTGDEEAFSPIDQEPADIILLSAADTDILTWSAALAKMPADFPSVRALNLDRLRNAAVFGAYLDDVLQEARVILVRVLGGLIYWREPLEAIHLLARTHGIALYCIPGDAQPDPELAALNTVDLPAMDQAFRYCAEGGVENAAYLLQCLAHRVRDTKENVPSPQPLPETGVYHPSSPAAWSLDQWLSTAWKPNQPTVAIAFYRSHWVTGNLAPLDALVQAFETAGVNALPVFGSNLVPILEFAFRDKSGLPAQSVESAFKIDAWLTTTSFALSKTDLLTAFDSPVFQAIFCSVGENAWAANIGGLSPRNVAMNIALPEFDGRIITTAVSFKNTHCHDPRLQTDIIRYQPRPDRIQHVTKLVNRWIRLRRLVNAEKRIAIILANYPTKNARVGNAVGLDTPASLQALLLALKEAGYDLGPTLPADGQELIHQLIAGASHDREFAGEHASLSVTLPEYEDWLRECPLSVQEGIGKRWGAPHASPLIHEDGFPVSGLRFGNVFIGIQPSRGYDQDPAAIYHSPDLEPPHNYLAFYRWLRHDFAADAVIHLGKHGNLEWLPGKSSALSEACYPEAMIQDLPNIYPYIINNPGEGTQAKRRSAAVIVDHLIPPMTTAGTYGELRELEALLDEFYRAQSLDPSKTPLLLERIQSLVTASQLRHDLELDSTEENIDALLGRLDGYLCEIKEAQIRDGLHVLGRLPEGPQLVDMILSMLRQDNGSVPGILKALTAETQRNADEPSPRSSASLRLNSSELLDTEARSIIESWLQGRRDTSLANTATEDYFFRRLWPNLQRCTDEITNILHALDGGFVPPGPSGAPTRGMADILPTGRNFYSLDIRAIPTTTAWRVGCAAADALLARHREKTGHEPESIALVVWGTSNMRTGGDDIAEILYLLGVRPIWDAENRRVVGLEPIPLPELNRPRIDVTIRISGLFRDAFPNLVRLLSEAVELVAKLEEPLSMNYVKAHIARDTAMLCKQKPEAEAEQLARLRVFGSKPGGYGAGLLPAIDNRNWKSVDDLARIYTTWSCYAYTGNDSDHSPLITHHSPDAFELRLSQIQVVVQNQDNREHDIFDSDDYFQFHGGMIATIRTLTGRNPAAYLGDTSRPDQVKARTLQEEAYRVFRSRVVNPKWLAGMMRHGYKGAVEMSATVDYLFGYDATAGIMDDWMYEKLAQSYVLDAKVHQFLEKANPWAERAMIERLLEAAQRGMWETPNADILQQLKNRYLGNEAWLESWHE